MTKPWYSFNLLVLDLLTKSRSLNPCVYNCFFFGPSLRWSRHIPVNYFKVILDFLPPIENPRRSLNFFIFGIAQKWDYVRSKSHGSIYIEDPGLSSDD